MRRSAIGAVFALALSTVLLADDVKFTSSWKSMNAAQVSFAGKRVAALVISNDDSLRVAGEEGLAKELSARGMTGVATYRIAPKEELKSAERAKVWFEKGNIDGVVAVRPISAEKRTTYTPDVWATPYYGTLWGYYGYGWTNVYIPGSVGRETVITVETTIYSVPRNELLWGAVSETRDPNDLRDFIGDLVKASVKELQKQGLAKGQIR